MKRKKGHHTKRPDRDNRSPSTAVTPPKPTRSATTSIIVGTIIKTKFGWSLTSTDRREKAQFIIRNSAKAESHAGELVAAKLLTSSKFGRQEVEITHVLGDPNNPRNISLIAIYGNDIPHRFSDAAVQEADAAQPVTLDGRVDLRQIPLVTIDGADSRDFDDAVFAEPHKDGWHLIVAIADVAHYVKEGSALDKDAYQRGNSVYFPDRVVPMLPEALSNELCSLKPQVERATMAVHMWLDKAGELTRWEFVRGVMKSKARLTYEQVQAAYDGKPDATTAPLFDSVIKPLYGAYQCLMQARLKRGTLELDLPERKVEIAADGTVKAIKLRERLDSHKLIEEFMIAANVAAAAQLEGKGGIALYRIHDKPSEMKLLALRDFLDSVGISLASADQLHPRMLTQILEQAAGTANATVINEVMLRSQAQAVYSPENIGHFGLALAKYAHFTSPIRRYADLVVHRGLIRTCKLGNDGLSDEAIKNLTEIGEHISGTERRAASAEREAVDRFTTLYLSDKIDAVFPARISGVARFGLFARLDESGADGIIPFNALPGDYYNYDEKRQAMVGQRHGRVFQLAQRLMVRLEEADVLTGSMRFAVVEEASAGRAARHPAVRPPVKPAAKTETKKRVPPTKLHKKRRKEK